jgi:hypothetical protein
MKSSAPVHIVVRFCAEHRSWFAIYRATHQWQHLGRVDKVDLATAVRSSLLGLMYLKSDLGQKLGESDRYMCSVLENVR